MMPTFGKDHAQPKVVRAAGSGGQSLGGAGDRLVERLVEVVGRQARSLVEVVRAGVAERDPRRAIGRAAIGLARIAAIDHDDRLVRPLDLDEVLHQHGAAAVQDHDVGRAVTLAGDDGKPAGLNRKVGNERVADHDGGGAVGQFQDPGLVETNGDRLFGDGRRGDGGENQCRREPMQRASRHPAAHAQRRHRYAPKRYADLTDTAAAMAAYSCETT